MSVDLSTRYLGLDLAHPVVPSASPLTGDIDHIHALVGGRRTCHRPTEPLRGADRAQRDGCTSQPRAGG